MKRRVVCCLLLLLLVSLLCACASQPTERTLFAMDTVMTLRIWGSNADAEAAAAELNALEAALSVTRSGSEIAVLNRSGSAELSADTAALLRRSLELCALTNGALDITVGPVAELWGFSTGDYRLPSAEAIAAALPLVDHTAVVWDGDRLTLPAGGSIVLGAVAKGYAADRLLTLLTERGVECAVLALGGNIQTVGTKPDGSDWQIAIRDPVDDSAYIGTLSVSGSAAVVTSGGYQRCFEADGQTYHHILDPQTGYPADNGLRSVTIVADSGLYADALSTAVYVMGEAEAVALWRQQGDFGMVLVRDDGSVAVTQGLRFSGADAGVIA